MEVKDPAYEKKEFVFGLAKTNYIDESWAIKLLDVDPLQLKVSTKDT